MIMEMVTDAQYSEELGETMMRSRSDELDTMIMGDATCIASYFGVDTNALHLQTTPSQMLL